MITESECDVDRLCDFFKSTLKFKVERKPDLSKDGLKAAVTEFRDSYMNTGTGKKYYCFFCVVMSHGDKVSKFKIHNGFVWCSFMVFNATFNNISVIWWRSVLLMDVTGENHRKSLTNFIT
jgi:hypothetical protein